jgi:hypothetical protein
MHGRLKMHKFGIACQIQLKGYRMKINLNRHCLLFIFIYTLLYSPIPLQSQTEPARKYATQGYNNKLLDKDNLYAARLSAMEDSIQPFLYPDQIERKTIPVVFHILQSPGMPYIPDSLLLRQLDQLNEDYNYLSFESVQNFYCVLQFINRALIPKLDFCLADSIGPYDIPYQVTRINTPVQTYSDYSAIHYSLLAGSDPVLPEHCLNIWICNLFEGTAGFAQYPGGPMGTDGIVMSYKFLIAPIVNGKRDPPYNLGRPLTHLVGNYLGVYELWNEAQECKDDFVYDTPVHNEGNHGFEIVCNHVTTCGSHPTEMFINFMDNTTDSLTVMFTRGQVYRMHAVLDHPAYRKGLWSLPLACADTISSITYIAPEIDTSTSTNTIIDSISFKPNPASTDLFIDVSLNEKSPVKVSMFDITGQLILTEHWDDNLNIYTNRIDVSRIPAGMYILMIETNTRSYLGKVVVIHN